MKDERYSALWVLVPLTGTLVAFTGGMLFRGWFAADFGLRQHEPVLIAAFIGAVLVTIAVVGGYLGALKRKIRPSALFAALTGLLVTFFCALSIGSIVDAFSGNQSDFVFAALSAFLALVFGFILKHKFKRNEERE